MKWIFVFSIIFWSLLWYTCDAFADILIIQSPGGVQTGTIITFPPPPSPYNPTWTPPPPYNPTWTPNGK